MLNIWKRWRRTGIFCTAISAGALLLAPASIFAAEHGHSGGHDRGRMEIRHFDRGRMGDSGRRFDHGRLRFDRDHDGRGFFGGGIVIGAVPEYGYAVPSYGYYDNPNYGYYNTPDYGYYNTPDYGYYNTPDYGYYNTPGYGYTAPAPQYPAPGCNTPYGY
jgi:hypothetical protein